MKSVRVAAHLSSPYWCVCAAPHIAHINKDWINVQPHERIS